MGKTDPDKGPTVIRSRRTPQCRSVIGSVITKSAHGGQRNLFAYTDTPDRHRPHFSHSERDHIATISLPLAT